jgi:hypothetical protein
VRQFYPVVEVKLVGDQRAVAAQRLQRLCVILQGENEKEDVGIGENDLWLVGVEHPAQRLATSGAVHRPLPLVEKWCVDRHQQSIRRAVAASLRIGLPNVRSEDQRLEAFLGSELLNGAHLIAEQLVRRVHRHRPLAALQNRQHRCARLAGPGLGTQEQCGMLIPCLPHRCLVVIQRSS